MTTSEELQVSFGYLFPDEVQALKQLAQSLPPNPIVVNIGAGAGTSGLAFMESREDLRLITVDIQYEDSPFGCIATEQSLMRQNGYSGRYFIAIGDSKQIGRDWLEDKDYRYFGKCDLCFIDADHSYNGCKGDILAWLPNIKPGGIMAVHDFEKKKRWKHGDLPDKVPHPLPWPGVDRAVRKFLCPNYETILKVDTLVAFRIK
jgi:predicted O-methyltransferase YrrM